MKNIFLLILALHLGAACFSQKLAGNWKGIISANGKQIPILFHFKGIGENVTGTWDSPSQNALGLPFSNIAERGDSVLLDIKMIGGNYKGIFINPDSITGSWSQGGGSIPLNFGRSINDSVTANTEEKTLPFPGEKELSITSSTGGKIYGTLLSKNNNQKLAIIIAGSGPTDRNGNNPLGDKAASYQLLAHALDSQNIASFRYDKISIGESKLPAGMNESDIVFENFIKDAERIFTYLHDTVGIKNIYFIGHSEGSLIGMVASQKTPVKGFISLAGSGRPFDVLINEQANTQQWPDSMKNKTRFILNNLKSGQKVADIPVALEPVFRSSVQPYMISLLKYNPATEIKKLKCPVLIVQGNCDIQVKVEDAKLLNQSAKKSILKLIPSMTHTLKDAAPDCSEQEKTYMDTNLPLDRQLVADVVDFIKSN
jgi:uncharacterized protein